MSLNQNAPWIQEFRAYRNRLFQTQESAPKKELEIVLANKIPGDPLYLQSAYRHYLRGAKERRRIHDEETIALINEQINAGYQSIRVRDGEPKPRFGEDPGDSGEEEADDKVRAHRSRLDLARRLGGLREVASPFSSSASSAPPSTPLPTHPSPFVAVQQWNVAGRDLDGQLGSITNSSAIAETAFDRAPSPGGGAVSTLDRPDCKSTAESVAQDHVTVRWPGATYPASRLPPPEIATHRISPTAPFPFPLPPPHLSSKSERHPASTTATSYATSNVPRRETSSTTSCSTPASSPARSTPTSPLVPSRPQHVRSSLSLHGPRPTPLSLQTESRPRGCRPASASTGSSIGDATLGYPGPLDETAVQPCSSKRPTSPPVSLDSTSSTTSSLSDAALDLTSCITFPDGARFPTANGGQSDIYCADMQGAAVAVKVIKAKGKRAVDADGERQQHRHLTKKIQREMKVWSRVTHPNVLPFLGFCFFQHAHESHSGEPDRISLISPWMQHGTATQYVKDHPGTDNVAIIRGVAEGLQYLHDNQIIHGDIKSGNVLMSECGTPLLSDFGLAILDDDSLNLSSEHITTSTTGVHGTTRWMAPELFPELFLKVSEEDLKPPKSNRETDVWAFGCFVLELVGLIVPYPFCKSDANVIAAILAGLRPFERSLKSPISSTNVPKIFMSYPQLWSLCMSCWEYHVPSRITVPEILRHLDGH